MPQYWGKHQDGEYHCLAGHCADVAAVARVLLESDPILQERCRCLSPLPWESTRDLLLFFAAIHDLGKFAAPFQGLVPELAERLGQGVQRSAGVWHTDLGLGFWEDRGRAEVEACGVEDAEWLSPLAEAAFGHHGQPLAAQQHSVTRHFRDSQRDALAFVREAATAFLPEDLPEDLDEDALVLLSWIASGLYVLADWIGSSREWFPFRTDWPGFDAYLAERLPLAREAVRRAGILPAAANPARDPAALLPHLAGYELHPLQRLAADWTAPDAPSLLIFEDLTGGGKTEAALLAAHALMSAGRAGGLFMGLPTMATANAMYARLGRSYQALFQDPGAVSLVLAHGGRDIQEDFQRSIGLERVGPGGDTDEAGNEAPFCSRWIADHRKRALLAPCGVGTLDQALLGVLPSRHQSLRLLGLARSVLIADEVHAYDEYTGRLLEQLLVFQGAVGGGAILLSATLPLALRERFVRAHLRGRALARGVAREDLEAWVAERAALAHADEPRQQDFPLATLVDDQVREQTFSASRELDVEIRPVHDPEEMYVALERAHGAGACACWVRNTVADAVTARRELLERFGLPEDDVLLFHARYAGSDRLRIEREVLERFGKSSTPESRGGKLLIATQVVEQSLDLDFDLLLSDLAPMELVIQRAGRCHRHLQDDRRVPRSRPEGYDAPLVLLLMPEPVENPPADWYSALFPIGQWVYPRPALLWRTARELVRAGRLRLPESARELMESAYGGEAPAALQDAEERALGENLANRAFAEQFALKPWMGYCNTSEWYPDQKTPTRLGEDSVTLRLLRVEGDGFRLWAAERPGDISRKACQRSEVRVSWRKLAGAAVSGARRDALERFAATLPDKGKWCVLLPLEEQEDGSWLGQGLSGGGAGRAGSAVTVRYGKEGLEILDARSA